MIKNATYKKNYLIDEPRVTIFMRFEKVCYKVHKSVKQKMNLTIFLKLLPMRIFMTLSIKISLQKIYFSDIIILDRDKISSYY